MQHLSQKMERKEIDIFLVIFRHTHKKTLSFWPLTKKENLLQVIEDLIKHKQFNEIFKNWK